MSDWTIDPLQREENYGNALNLLLPKTPDPIAPGVSSTSKDGSAALSVDRANSDDARANAWKTYADAVNRMNQAYDEPAPKLQLPRYSLVEAGLGTLLGGFLNQASPYSSEGTKALNAYVAAKNQNALVDYQNEATQHAQNIQGALQAYRAAETQAQQEQQQANQADQIQSASDRQQNQQSFDQRMQQERLSAQDYENALERDAQAYTQWQREQGQAVHDQQVQRLMANQAGIGLLSKTSHGRWLMGYRDAVASGMSPADAQKQANEWAYEQPDAVAKRLHGQLLQEETERAKPSVYPLTPDKLNAAQKALNQAPSSASPGSASPLNSFLLNLGLDPFGS